MNVRRLWIALFCLLVCTVGLADTLKLKDGTVLEGTVQEIGDRYWIKLVAGGTKFVKKSDVVSRTTGDAKPATPAPPTPTPAPATPAPATASPAKPGTESSVAPPVTGNVAGTSSSFASIKGKADRVDAPIQAVQLWDAFIAKAQGADLAAAKGELEKWTAMNKDNAEKIKGKWVGGVERKRIVKHAKNLVNEGVKDLEEGRSDAGFKKMEEALAEYPQSYEANFYLGFYYLRRGVIGATGRGNTAYMEKAIKTLEMATKVAPKSSSAWSNLAIGYSFKDRHKEAVQAAFKAATMRESKETVTNLIAAIQSAPRGLQEQAWARDILERAIGMAGHHDMQARERQHFVGVLPAEGDEIPGADGPAGREWSGSGFFVTNDGYILTNHHVATGDHKAPIRPDISFRIRLDDGTEKSAELIAVYDEADIALMKIVPDQPVVPLKLANYLPPQGSQLMALGYPATGDSEMTLQISDGSCKSTHDGDEHEVWLNLNTTHGNSGGPIVDANNTLVSIVTAYRQSYNMDIFLGVSTNQIKAFMTKIGDKAPKMEYIDRPTAMPAFDAEKLTVSARGSTVLIFAVKTSE
ncbi:hypothetical protein BH09PLA1_BH09PLA1_14420 [soil metagenome]